MKKLIYDLYFCTNFLCIFFVFADGTRPNFRSDYIYEKAFASFYKVHKIAMSWPEARLRCEAELGQLLVPETLDEAEALSVLTAQILHKYVGVYIGIHDMFSEGTYITNNGTSLLGTILGLLWEGKQPETVGRCVAMRRSGKLFVYPCEGPLPFVCKIKEQDIKHYDECDTFDPDQIKIQDVATVNIEVWPVLQTSWKLGPTGNCYIRHMEPQPWHLAYATCLAKGGYLVVINNRTEADFVRDLFKEVPERKVPDTDFAFLGFTDLFRRHHYRTIHGQTLEEAGFRDWDLKCNSKSGTDEDNRCGGIRRSGLLSTVSCDMPATFFCEKPITAQPKALRNQKDYEKINKRIKEIPTTPEASVLTFSSEMETVTTEQSEKTAAAPIDLDPNNETTDSVGQ